MTTTAVPIPTIPTIPTSGTATTSSPPEMRRSAYLARLDQDWVHLRTSRRALGAARAWAERYPGHPLGLAVADLNDLDQILQATQRTSDAERSDDAVLLALVELARTDQLAGRIVLQHLLPALMRHSRRYWSFRDRTDPLEVVVPATWVAIRCYVAERRREHVASSLVSDAVFQAFRRPLRRMSSTEEVWAPTTFTSTPGDQGPTSPFDEFVSMIDEAERAGVPSYDIDLLCHLVRAGSPGVVAKERNVTPRTIRNQRGRAVDHVRTALAVAA